MQKRYALRIKLVLILAGLAVGCSAGGAHSASPASERSATSTASVSVPSRTLAVTPNGTAASHVSASSSTSSDTQRDTRPLIACFGDSLTAGLGIASDESYPANLQRMLDEEGYHYRVVNYGVSGDTTKDGLDRVQRVLASKPEIVVLEFGGNDGLRGVPVRNAESNLASMIEALQRGGAKVVLAGISLPPQYGGEYITQFNAMYPALAKRFHVRLLPFLLQGVWGVDGDMQEDGVHPTAQGAKQVAVNVEKLLQPVLTK